MQKTSYVVIYKRNEGKEPYKHKVTRDTWLEIINIYDQQARRERKNQLLHL